MHPSLTCAEKSGFLFPHPCGRPSAGQCELCGKQLCNAHLVPASGGYACSSCAAAESGERAGGWRDRSFYGYGFYPGYGSYRRGWGSGYLHHHHDHYDSDDFTEADGMSTRAEGDEAFESDMGAS